MPSHHVRPRHHVVTCRHLKPSRKVQNRLATISSPRPSQKLSLTPFDSWRCSLPVQTLHNTKFHPCSWAYFYWGQGVGGSVSKENHSGNRCLAVPSMVRSRSGGAGFRGDLWRGDPRPGHLHHPYTRPCPCTNRAPFYFFVS